MKSKINLDLETEFFINLLGLNYGEDLENKLKTLSAKIPWAKGWPEKKSSFWNAEAFMWQYKIKKTTRELIKKELQYLEGKKNLDLGCGAYSYLPSIGFDLSEKMLQFNENCSQKIIGDLEKELPFSNQSFQSVTAIFVLNYVQNYQLLLKEIKRILIDQGIFMMVLSSKSVNEWQKQKEVNDFSLKKWESILQTLDFEIEIKEKGQLLFFSCKKV